MSTTTPSNRSMSSRTRPATQYAVSSDGTRIAYEVHGAGPALVIVDGALCQRAMGPSRPLASRLAAQFSVHVYDRRGRGQSEQGHAAYHPDREVEDLAAVISAAGGHAHAFGASSGAALVLLAAQAGVSMDRIAVYEAPFIVDDTHEPHDLQLAERTQALIGAGRHGDAVKLFMRTVGAPRLIVAAMPLFPVWRKLCAVAPTLPHDYAIVLDRQQGRPLPEGAYEAVSQPVLVIAGGKSPTYLKNSQAALVAGLAAARLQELPGQTHMIKAKVTAPVVSAHLLSP